MSHTCLGCAHFERLMVRGQWITICRKTHKTAPMAACEKHEPRWGEQKRKAEMGVELL